jgi:homoserine O-acetyltransferase
MGNDKLIVHPDDGECSVGLVEKKFYAFGSEQEPFVLENRQELPHVEVAYETYGTLNDARDNAILVTHGITGSSHAAGVCLDEPHLGFWDG